MNDREYTTAPDSDLVTKTGQALNSPLWMALIGVIAGHTPRLKVLFNPDAIDPGFSWSMALPFFVIAAIAAAIVVYSVYESRRQISVTDRYYDRTGSPDSVTLQAREQSRDNAEDIYSDV